MAPPSGGNATQAPPADAAGPRGAGTSSMQFGDVAPEAVEVMAENRKLLKHIEDQHQRLQSASKTVADM